MHLKIQAIKNHHTPHRLFLEVGDDYIAACTTSSENIIAAFHLYSYKNMDDFAEILYAVKEGFAQANNELPVNVVCQNAYATCIPKEFLQESNDAVFLNKILNVPSGYEMFCSSLNDIDIAYFVDSKKLQTLKKAFPGIKITHKYSTIIHRIVNTIKADGKLLYAIFYDHAMILAAFSNRDKFRSSVVLHAALWASAARQQRGYEIWSSTTVQLCTMPNRSRSAPLLGIPCCAFGILLVCYFPVI